MSKSIEQEIEELVELYVEYSEHDEYHVDCDKSNGHLEFDEDKLKAQLLTLIDTQCKKRERLARLDKLRGMQKWKWRKL